MDTVSKQKRSEIMSKVRSKDSVMEKTLRKELSKSGIRYRKNVSKLKGKPDLAFTRKKVVVFLDSCFWHGCRFHCRFPTANRVYWKTKIERNKNRDKEVTKFYKEKGWTVLRFWEHQIKKNLDTTLKKIRSFL